MKAQTEVEQGKIDLGRAEVDLRYADIGYRKAQAATVTQSLIVNREIEQCKCETQLKIAQLQAESL
jgi:hypothetical protein